MKRILALLIALTLLIGCACAESAAEPGTETGAHQIEKKTFAFYMMKPDKIWREDFPLYFLDGANDLPYIEVNDLAEVMNRVFPENGEQLFDDYAVTVETLAERDTVIITRENGFHMILDFGESEIIFDDFLAFLQPSVSEMYVDISGLQLVDESGLPYLLSLTGSRNRYGEITDLKLKDYGIELIAQDGLYLIPMQTANGFLFNPSSGRSLYYNGQTVFYADVEGMKDPIRSYAEKMLQAGLLPDEFLAQIRAMEGTQEERLLILFEMVREASEEGAQMVEAYEQAKENGLYKLYSAVESAERSEALINYGYNELCLELDCFYGLKEAHNISDFNTFFLQTGLYDALKSLDAATADAALSELTLYWMDDGHSAFIGSSWMAAGSPEQNLGFSNERHTQFGDVATNIRRLYPEASQAYYEVGDTAYVVFDAFDMSGIDEGEDSPDYYALAQTGELPEDTIGIIIQAHAQITRENSPIKNVVLDLSCNGGGLAATALYTLGWFLGNGPVSIHNTFTGSETTATYAADVNLDHEFNEEDTLAGRGLNLYCLISPLSFSCGNLVPWAFKEDGSVTLLGKVSGGGSCIVGFVTSAWGTSYRISSSMRLAFVKNGSYYDVDQGVEPDHTIDTYEHFYDREALTEFIHGLY